jgi:hypothetical protein
MDISSVETYIPAGIEHKLFILREKAITHYIFKFYPALQIVTCITTVAKQLCVVHDIIHLIPLVALRYKVDLCSGVSHEHT